MALSHDSYSGFAALPREIRDMVFAEVASAAGVTGYGTDTIILLICDEQGYGGCIKMVHEWASRSYIAKAACEELWASCAFRCKWDPWSYDIIGQETPLFLKSLNESGKSEFIPLEAPIDPMGCLREISLTADLAFHGSWNSDSEDQPNLYKLGQDLAKLARSPRLHKLRINVSIPLLCNFHHIGMLVLKSLSQPCRQLRRKLRTKFKVWLIQYWPIIPQKRSVSLQDISMMWGPS